MSMGDYYSLPIKHERNGVFTDTESKFCVDAGTMPRDCGRFAHAINCHDDLVDALEACLNFIENTESEWATILSCGDMARAAIVKAKGTNNA